MNGQPIIDIQVQRMVGVASDDLRPQHVYICRTKNGTVLYVGVSLNAMERLAQHSYTSHWFKCVTHIEIERLPNRMAALEREKHLIQTIFPMFNTIHVDRVAAMVHFFRQVPEDQQVDLMLSLFRKLSLEAQAELTANTFNALSDEERVELRQMLENPEMAPEEYRPMITGTLDRIKEAAK